MAQFTSTGDKAYWVIVADEAAAVIYLRETRRGPLRELLRLENEAARKKTDELISDRGGRSFDSHGQGRHTMSKEKSDPKTQSALMFAKHIAERIAKATHNGSCRGFALVAAPRFLGLLRDAISKSTHMDPFATIDKEVVDQDTSVIEKLLSEA